MKNTLLFLFISTFFTLNAQTINIEWDGAKAHSVDYDTNVNLPFFNNKGYSVINNVPMFMHLEKVAGMGKVTIENIQYTSLNSSERGQLNINEIPPTLGYDARIQKGGDEYSLTVSMVPFVREGNQIKKVTSFQIVSQQGVPPDYQPEETYDPATQSVLRVGNWYKIKIKKSGIFRIDRAFFTQNGIPTNFDPRTLKIYGNGGKMLNENPGDFRYGALQENAIQFNGEEDGSFDSGDVILFYAQGPHDWNRKNNSTLTNLSHRFNVYSDEAYYFITFGGQNGKRVQNVEIPGSPTQTFNQYHEYVFHEKDSINLNQIGRQWGGEMFNLEPSQNFVLTGNGSPVGEVVAKYQLLGQFANSSTYSVLLNGASVGGGPFTAGSFIQRNGQSVVPAGGNVFTFNVTVENGNPNALIFLDYLEVKYLANLSFNGSQMKFRRLENLNDGNVYGFSISGAQKVWNISDITTAANITNAGGIYKYQSTSPYFLNEFIAFNESSALTEIEYSGSVVNQNIRALSDIDYAIVVHPDYLSEASRLANFRQTHDGVKVAVVTTEQVYNDFSSGAQDISAIRDFFKHLRDNGNPLKYTLLFGGASYDFKNRIVNNSHFVPSYQSMISNGLSAEGEPNSYVTDDFFTMLDDTDVVVPLVVMGNDNNYLDYFNNGAPQMDVAVGRMPAHNQTEARVMVDKTIAYYNKQPNQGTSFGDWKTKFHLVVDDDDPGPLNAFHTLIESTSAQFIQNNISYATVRKLYFDAFPATGTSGGQRYPQVNQGIANAFDLGSALIVYFGHGGPRSWSQERVITYEEINNFSNFTGLYSRLPVVLTITCDFTVWDVPEIASAGTYMYKNPTGGAVAMITTSRPIATTYGKGFNEPIVEKLLEIDGKSYLSIGEGLRDAKVNYNGPGSGVNHYSVNLLGDPMLSITRPPRDIRITKINGEDAATFTGLLRALDFVEIEGEVLNENGTSKDVSFNGKANATLFDKPLNKTTLNNDGNIDVLNYQEQVSAIFKGGTNVNNGDFKFQFYVPKDINYEIGNGKLVVYAHNNVTDAVTTKIVRVGDQNPNGLDDDNGPAIGLYMNNLNFVDGGITDRDPYILACLVDSTGINTSGVAIGHDITGVLDGNVEGTYVLNEYYEGGDNNPCTNPQVLDYQKGQVMYKLSRLALGSHQIVFKAWDINNNSSEQTLDFVVMEDGSDHIYIDKLLNWPNPFTNQTYFHFEHNCDSELDVMVQIFTISGKLVKTIRQPVSAEPWREGYRTGRFAIPWDGLDDFGDKIGKGVYIYRVTVRGVDSELCKGSATAIEKLVILK
ncbi:type IX secretion system sortase PorU [Moheibacter sediminis]|uniref:Peptidase family C25 n=1 Tax=Moheibacter sediminis TaxID=1434700 RepID=A0A1W1ZNS6_9FLAO|nr:type IX secretion system sortase PorU [Moheibacter sediminis]SMC50007.1 Peptidase family C25 [Moheibacter sediminis]